MAISKSVGQGGANLKPDVEKVQTLLNQHIALLIPLKKLKVDGDCGARTIEAIRLFQERVVHLVAPDAKIDPGGPTWRVLSTLPPESFLALPSSPYYYSYEEPAAQFGTVLALQSLAEAAKEFYGSQRLQLGIGDISLQRGGEMPGHLSHQNGRDIDIRPLRLDGKSERTRYGDATYSHDRTKKLVEILRRDPNLSLIFFNDTGILGVQKATGHDNHLHVRYKA